VLHVSALAPFSARILSHAQKYDKVCIQGVPGVQGNTSGFNSRTDAESKTSYTWVQIAAVQDI
jgi:hypothetical protein